MIKNRGIFNRTVNLKIILKNYYVFLRDFFADLLDDKLGHYASSLSWSTLFSIIPLMVITLAIFTSMPIFHQVYGDIEELIFSNIIPTHSELVIGYINEFVISTDKLGKVGAIYVFIALTMFFKNYDYIVNDIFDIPSRKFAKAFKVYSMLLFVIPLVLGLFFYISSFLQGLLDKSTLTEFIHIFTLLPFLSTWMTFYITYQVSANTSIDVPAAVISSFIASLVWYLSKSAFVFYVVHNKTYESIYGNISTLLFFFVWIYISWVIFLHGLKFCNLLNKEEEIDHIA